MLSDLTADANAAVEAQLVAINQITSAYDIEVDANYEKLTEGDADEILDHVTTITHLCVDSETERVMKALATADRKLPVAAIKEVREHQDIFLPLLMQALEQAVTAVRNGEETVKRALKDCRPTGMADTIAELSRWAAFQEEPPRPPKKPTTQSAHVSRPHLSFSDSDRPQPVTTVHADRKVGRNDPCPCGSGKKFKKCCR